MSTTALNWIKKQAFLYAAGLFILCLGNNAIGMQQAQSAQSIYEIELPLQIQSQLPAGVTPEVHLSKEAFKQVLTKATGSEVVLNAADVIKALQEVNQYVSQISYQKPVGTTRTAKVKFSEKLTRELLTKINQSIWTEKRPLTLVWLVVERDNTVKWVSEESEIEIKRQLESMAEKRSIPLIFPILDLTDTAVVSEQDVLNNAFEPLKLAAKRYNASTLLIGKIKPEGNGLQGQCTLLREGESEQPVSWEIKQAEPNTLLSEMMENLSGKLKNKFVAATTTHITPAIENHHILLAVSGVLNADQYGKVMDYLQSLPFVTEVEVEETTFDKTIFGLQTTANSEVMTKSLATGGVLLENPVLETGQSPMLHYKLDEAL